ncbi:MAG: hypothetical protein JWM57_2950 [Phycisphaerales bacterium]|nr:hypothetical protein [Phycisphaerales bacterium]
MSDCRGAVMSQIRIVGFKLALLAAVAATALPANAQTSAPAAVTTAEATTESLQATVTGVEGMVQVRQNDKEPWAKAQVGMLLGEMSEIRTGPRSAVRCTLPPDQTFTLDRLGTVKLLEAVRNNKTINTDLMMKYGRVRLDVESAGLEHRSVIRSPSSTLAVRGTRVSLYDQRPFNPEAVSLTGTAIFRDGKKQIAFGAKGQGKTKVDSKESSAVALAISKSTLDPSLSLARTVAETALIDTLISHGSTVSFDRDAGIKVVTGGRPPTDGELIPTLPGVLNFVARWNTNADLNFSVQTPGGVNNAGETLYPAGALATNSSGGKVPFDHRGGPNGGIEIVYFPKGAPTGLYGLGLTLISGNPTTAQVDAFQDGKRIKIFDGISSVDSVTTQVDKPIAGFVDGTAVGVVPIGTNLPSGASRAANHRK